MIPKNLFSVIAWMMLVCFTSTNVVPGSVLDTATLSPSSKIDRKVNTDAIVPAVMGALANGSPEGGNLVFWGIVAGIILADFYFSIKKRPFTGDKLIRVFFEGSIILLFIFQWIPDAFSGIKGTLGPAPFIIGIWMGGFSRYLIWKIGKFFSSERPSINVTDDQDPVKHPLWGWGSEGASVVILSNKVKNKLLRRYDRASDQIHSVTIPAYKRGPLRILAFGLSRSELSSWAGHLLSSFEDEGHLLGEFIFRGAQIQDTAISEKIQAILTGFKPHVVVVPHQDLDQRPMVAILNQEVHSFLKEKAASGERDFILIEYETNSPWLDLVRKQPDLKTAPLIKLGQSEFEDHFNSYLFYRSFRDRVKSWLFSLYAYVREINALLSVERFLAKGSVLRGKLRPRHLGGPFVQRFRVKRIKQEKGQNVLHENQLLKQI